VVSSPLSGWETWAGVGPSKGPVENSKIKNNPSKYEFFLEVPPGKMYTWVVDLQIAWKAARDQN
jgi:hypothetical protein